MAEQANFALRLVDKVTGPARRMKASLSSVQASLKKTGAMAGQFDKVAHAVDRFAGRHKQLRGFQKRLHAAAWAAKDGTSAFGVLARVLAGPVVSGFQKAGKGFVAFKKSGAGKFLDKGGDKLVHWGKQVAIVGGALGAFTAGALVKATVGMAAFAEQARLALGNLTGSKAGGEQAFQRTIALSKEFGLNIQDVTGNMTKLLAAQFKLGEAEELIKLTTDLRAVGSSAEQVESTIRAITQIKSKGNLALEELTGQLSEANVSADMVIGQLMTAMGKSRQQVFAAITARQVDAVTGIAAIKKAILAKAHIKTAGDAGKRFANETLGGMIQRLKNAPSNFTFQVAELLGTEDVKTIVRDITAMVEGISPGGTAAFVKDILRLVRDGIPLMKAFTEGFGEGFQAVLDGLKSSGGTSKDSIQLFRDLGKAMADGFGLGIKLLQKVSEFIVWLSTPTGEWTVKIGLGAIAVLKLTDLVMGLATAWGSVQTAMAFMGLGGAGKAAAGGAAKAAGPGLLRGAAMVGGGAMLNGLKAVPALAARAGGALATMGAAALPVAAAVVGGAAVGGAVGYGIAEATGLNDWSKRGHGNTQAAGRGIGGAVIRPGSMGGQPRLAGRAASVARGNVTQTVNVQVDATGATDPRRVGRETGRGVADAITPMGASLAYGG
jgi:tape measure domain-containing protein